MTRTIMIAALTLPLLAACTTPPKTDPIIIKTPVDAFDSVGHPHAPSGRVGGGLGTDIQRLQEAHQLYELSKDRRQSAVKNSQAHCLKQEDSRRVPIQGAAAPDAVFCEPSVQ